MAVRRKDENGENKNVDGKVSTDELTENTGNQKRKFCKYIWMHWI